VVGTLLLPPPGPAAAAAPPTPRSPAALCRPALPRRPHLGGWSQFAGTPRPVGMCVGALQVNRHALKTSRRHRTAVSTATSGAPCNNGHSPA
jgi:hypothetical protein